MDEKEFVIITEDADPQREILIENFCGSFEIIIQGDAYHNGVSGKIAGFLEGMDYLKVDYIVRQFNVDDLGDGSWFGVRKKYLSDSEEGYYRDTFYIETKTGYLALEEEL